MDTLALKVFITLNDCRSFSQTASKMGRTQSAISQSVSRLEDLVGKKLFTRGQKPTLTQDGELFLNYARKIIDLENEMLIKIKQEICEGEIHFGLPEDFASLYLSHILVNFFKEYPRIRLNAESDLSAHLKQNYDYGKLDIILVKSLAKDQRGIEVMSEKLRWVGNPELLSNARENKTPIPLILAPQPCVYRARALNTLHDHGLEWNVVFSSHSYSSTMAAVKANLGLTVALESMIPNYIHVCNNQYLPELGEAHINIHCHEPTTSATRALINFIITQFKVKSAE